MNNRDKVIILGKKYLIIWIITILLRAFSFGMIMPFLIRVLDPEIYGEIINTDNILRLTDFLSNILIIIFIIVDFKKYKLDNLFITAFLTLLAPLTGIAFLLLNVALIKEKNNE